MSVKEFYGNTNTHWKEYFHYLFLMSIHLPEHLLKCNQEDKGLSDSKVLCIFWFLLSNNLSVILQYQVMAYLYKCHFGFTRPSWKHCFHHSLCLACKIVYPEMWHIMLFSSCILCVSKKGNRTFQCSSAFIIQSTEIILSQVDRPGF